MRKDTEALSGASREVGLEADTVKTKYMVYMVVYHFQNAGQKHNSLIANKSFENVAKFRYL